MATPTASPAPAKTSSRKQPPSLLERCFGCLFGGGKSFARFEDEGPSEEFKARMARASTAMAINEQTKSRMDVKTKSTVEVVPVPVPSPSERSSTKMLTADSERSDDR